jgi:hypothetical protein
MFPSSVLRQNGSFDGSSLGISSGEVNRKKQKQPPGQPLGKSGASLPAFAESPVRKGGDECEKGIHRSLLTAIASAAAVGEGGSASAGSAEDVKMPRAAARGASLFLMAILRLDVPR